MAGWFGNLPVKLRQTGPHSIKSDGDEGASNPPTTEEIVVRQARKPTPHMSYTLSVCCFYLIHRYKNSSIPISVDLLNFGHNVGV